MSATPADPDPRDGLLAGIDDLLTPWLIWAGHFAFSYAWLAVRCVAAPSAVPGAAVAAGSDVTPIGLVVAALIAFGLLGWRIYGGWRSRRHADPAASAGARCELRLGSALLALLASVWTVLPMGLVHGCGP